MEKKVVPGIWVRYKTDKKSGKIVATFFISQGIPSRSFFSNPEIRKAIKNFQRIRKIDIFGKELGYIRADFNNRNKTLILNRLYPFGSKILEFEEIFGKRGIAQLLENHFRRRAIKAFPLTKNVEEWEPSTERFKQTLKRRFMGSSYSPEEWKSNLKTKIRNDTKKAKKKKRNTRRTATKIK